MKNIFSTPLTFKEQSNINKVVLWLTLILLICAVAMRIFGVLADFNFGSAILLWLVFIGAFSFDGVKKETSEPSFLPHLS